MKPSSIAIVAVVVLASVGVYLLVSSPTAPTTTADAPTDAPAAVPDGPLRSLIAGGGDAPESNEVSIEDDMLLAAKLLPEPQTVLYAAGTETNAVRVTADERPPTLEQRLGTIFNPRAGRSSTYRPTRIDADGAASPTSLLEALSRATQEDADEPLTVYLAGHGGPGETAAQNTFALWGSRSLYPTDLAAAFAAQPPKRDVRIIMTTCFSGGFAEVAFSGDKLVVGDEAEGEVCGLFASTWDREAGGCDPNPERGLHDGYGVHFLDALSGTTRAGERVPPSPVTGRKETTFLDAHTYARLRSSSIDVPTTTSEWHLRNVVASSASRAAEPGLLPHEDRVVKELGARLNLPDEDAARRRLAELNRATNVAREAEAEAAETETNAYYDVAAELLARWPVLDDPWHPEWRSTLQENREAIQRHLDGSAAVARLDAAMERTNRLANDRAELEVRVAPILRLARAHENRRLAAGLRHAGGPDWRRFQRLRRCEDSRP